jgi:hypothetical protein
MLVVCQRSRTILAVKERMKEFSTNGETYFDRRLKYNLRRFNLIRRLELAVCLLISLTPLDGRSLLRRILLEFLLDNARTRLGPRVVLLPLAARLPDLPMSSLSILSTH